ncbi:hypothetical protein FRC10_006504 [Ceratobasidium sp. 414]|nr:hypothetical protein FRC10_006504 [Ceratobasidium sp. 414]
MAYCTFVRDVFPYLAKPAAAAKAMASTTKSAAPAVTPKAPSTKVSSGAPAPTDSGMPAASSSKPRKRPLTRPPPSEPPVDGDQVAVATREAKPELIEEVSRGKHPRVAHTIKRTNVIW